MADEPPTWTRRASLFPAAYPTLHFESDVLPGMQVVVEVICERTAAYNALFVDTPEGFDVEGLAVAGSRQFPEGTSIPASYFSEGAYGIRLMLAEISEGTVVSLTVRSTSDVERELRARLVAMRDDVVK
jgi:hypothetical protein